MKNYIKERIALFLKKGKNIYKIAIYVRRITMQEII